MRVCETDTYLIRSPMSLGYQCMLSNEIPMGDNSGLGKACRATAEQVCCCSRPALLLILKAKPVALPMLKQSTPEWKAVGSQSWIRGPKNPDRRLCQREILGGFENSAKRVCLGDNEAYSSGLEMMSELDLGISRICACKDSPSCNDTENENRIVYLRWSMLAPSLP